MKVKNWRKLTAERGKAYWRWWISYVLVLVIPLLLSLALYENSKQMIETETYRVHQEALARQRHVSDAALDEIIATINLISLDKNMQSMAYNEGTFTARNYIGMSEIQGLVTKYTIINPIIRNIFVYFPSQDYAFDKSSAYNRSEMQTYFSIYYNINYKDMQTLFSSSQTYEIVPLTDTLSGARRTFLMHTVFARQGMSVGRAMIAVELDMDKLLQNAGIIDNPWNVFWLDKYPSYERFETLGFETEDIDSLLAKTIDRYIIRRDGKLLMSVASTHKGLRYFARGDIKEMMREPRRLQIIFVVLFAMSLMLGTAMIMAFVRRQYEPLHHLVTTALKQIGTIDTGRIDEYRYLETGFTKIADENTDIKQRLKQQEVIMRKALLGRVLRGHVRSMASIADALAEYGIVFPSDEFIVAQVTLLNRLEETAEEEAVELEMMFLIIRNMFEDLVGKSHRGYLVDMDGVFSMLISSGGGCVDFSDDVRNMSKSLVEAIRERFEVDLFVAVSQSHVEALGIAAAYSEATEITQYAELIDPGTSVLTYQTFTSLSNRQATEDYMTEGMIRFAHMIQAGNFEQSFDHFAQILSHYLPSDLNSLPVAKGRMFSLINQLLSVFETLKGHLDEDFLDGMDVESRLLQTRSMQELKREMHDILNSIASRFVEQKRVEIKVDRIKKLMNFVEEHYADPSLNVTMVADSMGINLAYLSRYYKKETGMGILDCIHLTRIERAKSLVLQTGLTIKEIAQRVGYGSDLTMIRAFKRYEGLTPGKLRERGELK